MKQSSNNIGSKLALFGAALIWGSSFLIVKNSVDVIQPHFLLGFRFTIGCLLLCIIFHKKLKQLNKDYFIKGGIIGFFLFGGYSLQTIGITDTTPGKNAFLTSIYCVLVPFLYWLIDKKKPDIYNFSAAFISIAGIGMVSLTGDFNIRMGDAFTLAGGVLYTCHVVAVTKFGSDKDPILLTMMQFGFAAIFSWIISFLFEDIPMKWSGQTTFGMLYLAVFATTIAILFQNIGQKNTNPAPAAIIMSLESVFGVLFSVVFYHEILTLRLLCGFLLIFIAVIISETKLSFLRKSSTISMIQEDIG